MVITFKSHPHDMTSIERYVDQKSISFIRDVTYALRRLNECSSSMYEPRRSKIGSPKEIVEECTYLRINWAIF